MANSKAKTKSKKKSKSKLYGLYGARISESGKYVNLSVVTGELDEESGTDSREWGTVIVKKKGNYVKVKVSANSVTLTIPRLDVEDDEEEEEDEDDEDDGDVLDGLTPIEDDSLPW